LQVWKIEDFLTKWEGSCSGASAADLGKAAIALVLLQEIDTYRCGNRLTSGNRLTRLGPFVRLMVEQTVMKL
jgi:hypothetical protein